MVAPRVGPSSIGSAPWHGRVHARGAVHNLVVDTYAMQHPEEYCRSPKSYVQHLTALCCGVEAPNDPSLYWAIPRWLDGPTALERPANIESRGTMTIADICNPANDDRYTELDRRWAQDVWAAYAVHHELAQRWLDAVRAHMARRGVRPRG